jgi:tetratricopeptide (TPR) repeat protein
MKGRLLAAYGGLGLALIFAVVAGLRLLRQPPPVDPIVAELPAMPDLSRWPQEMRERVAAAHAATADPGATTKAAGELAWLYFANGYAAEAAQALGVLIRLDPAQAHWPYLLGVLKERSGDREGAEAQFAVAVRLAPGYAPALIHLANLQALLGRSDPARRLFEQGLVLAPDDPRVPFGLAKLDFARGDERAAIARLRTAVVQHPKYQETHLMLADLLAKAGDLAAAEEQRAFLYGGQGSPPDSDPWLDEAVRYSYDSFRLLSLGEARNMAQDFGGALPYLQRAARLEPKDLEIQESFARALIGARRLDEAERTLRLALDRIGPDDLLYDRLAEVLIAHDRAAEALVLVLDVRRNRPGSALIANSVGLAQLALGRTADAIEAFTAAAKLDPNFADPRVNLARCQLKSGDPAQARSWLEQALKIRPEALEALAMLTEAELQEGDVDAALASARELFRRGLNVAEYRSVYAAALFRAGNLAAERGEHDQAEQWYRDGIAVNDRDGRFHGALGMLYGKLHRYTEARGEFETFLRLDPRNPAAYILLGSAFSAEGKPAEARQAWTTGLGIATELKDSARELQLRRLLGQ